MPFFFALIQNTAAEVVDQKYLTKQKFELTKLQSIDGIEFFLSIFTEGQNSEILFFPKTLECRQFEVADF